MVAPIDDRILASAECRDRDQRLARWAVLAAVHRMRNSIAANRPMSLPNLLRLYCRMVSVAGDGAIENSSAGMEYLRRTYLARQPFRVGWPMPE